MALGQTGEANEGSQPGRGTVDPRVTAATAEEDLSSLFEAEEEEEAEPLSVSTHRPDPDHATSD